MKNRGVALLLIIGAAALVIRTLLDSRFGNGTLLYLVVPFVISVALYGLTRPSKRQGLAWDYLNHLRFATIIFLATSALLFEGFLCVLMFMPIYYIAVSIGYLFRWILDRDGAARDRVHAFAIPALVAVLATEGMSPQTSFPRDRIATFSKIADADVATLQRNMAAPIVFPGKRPWFISLFPLPDKIQAGSLAAGDIHRLHFTYKKWFFTNYSEGEMDIRIAEVTPRRIRTQILKNTAYVSHYMRIDGTEVRFDPLADGRTRVTLSVHYRRLLDPAWYFGPMQHSAAEQSARYLVDNIIIRKTQGQHHGA